jgi:type III pantothenate kinase
MLKPIVTYDLGNSNPHLALFVEGKLQSIRSEMDFFSHFAQSEWENWTFVLSQVGKSNQYSLNIKKAQKAYSVKDFRNNHRIGNMPIHYQETLGDDRLIQAYYLFQKSSAKKILLIDAGTFITIDFINRSEQEGFMGGYIFPGINSFLKSYERGAQLPGLTPDKISWEKNELPHSTNEAILSATKIYIESLLSYFNQILDEDFEIVLTGGDAFRLNEILKLKASIHCSIQPELIHHALFYAYQSLGETK